MSLLDEKQRSTFEVCWPFFIQVSLLTNSALEVLVICVGHRLLRTKWRAPNLKMGPRGPLGFLYLCIFYLIYLMYIFWYFGISSLLQWRNCIFLANSRCAAGATVSFRRKKPSFKLQFDPEVGFELFHPEIGIDWSHSLILCWTNLTFYLIIIIRDSFGCKGWRNSL